jgi:ATP:ADP antiporter, AAA family
MSNRIAAFINDYIAIERHERLKVLMLSLMYFLIVGGYTLARELKDSLFVHIVGRDYIPVAKIVSMIILIPGILLFSRLVDLMRKHNLLYVYTIFYGVVGLVIVYFLGHPTIGLANTDVSKYRIFGWFTYFFIEGYSPFVVSLFWAFVNSVTAPEAAKNNYPPMIACSKLGGILTAALALWLLSRNPVTNAQMFSDVVNHQILFLIAWGFLLFVPLCVYILINKVPNRYMHGYEAAYRAEKHGLSPVEGESAFARLFSGLTLLLRYPYVLGIFGMLFFWEVVSSVFGYERLAVGQTIALNISDYTRFLFEGAVLVHLAGFVIVTFGTRFIVTWLGERRSLVLLPVLTGALLLYYLSVKTAGAVLAVFVVMRALNYAFATPLRESLYIPTTKDMRFKSKSWIDAFGSKVAKASGSLYKAFLQTINPAFVGGAHAAFFTCIVGTWIIAAHLLGRRFEKAVKNNEVIGLGKV